MATKRYLAKDIPMLLETIDGLLTQNSALKMLVARMKKRQSLIGAIDHIDGNPNNNDLANLRIVALPQNTR